MKTLLISATIATTALASVGTASADDWRYRHHRNHGGGDAVAAGVAGLAVGALLGSALSQPPRQRVYIDEDPGYVEPAPIYDEPSYVYRPAPVYRTTRVIVDQPAYYTERPALRPWSRSWMRFCTQRYRSFDPGTGTFIGNDGREHFCRG